jgi:hypothetical protein
LPFQFNRRTIKRLKVVVDRHGALDAYNPNLHDQDGWWEELLADPRAREAGTEWKVWRQEARLLPGKILEVTCDRCGNLRIERDGDELAKLSTPDAPVSYIAYSLTECRVRSKACRFRWRMKPKG